MWCALDDLRGLRVDEGADREVLSAMMVYLNFTRGLKTVTECLFNVLLRILFIVVH